MADDIFVDEWRECLRAHYMHVIRNRDHVTEPSLRVVMGQAGFTESELAELRVRATMHVDDSGPDFVPELDVLAETGTARVFPAAAPPAPEAAILPPAPEDEDALLPVMEDALPIEADDALDGESPPPAEDIPDEAEDDDAPAQLSLF